MCLPLRHRMEIRSAERFLDISFGDPGERRTRVLRVCRRCGKVKVETVSGHWEVLELSPLPPELERVVTLRAVDG